MTKAAEAQEGQATSKAALALLRQSIVDPIAKRVQGYISSGQLHLPRDYSPDNAMKAAWLVLQGVEDTNHRPALSVCSHDSIANALFSMVVQGLDPIKQQCYFIVYGKTLTCQRSYFGAIAQAQRMAGVANVLPLVRYEGEEFQIAVERGRYVVERHVPSVDVKGDTPITHAYCVVEFVDGRPPITEVMRWDQIQMSWKKSKTYKPDGNSGMHHEQPDQAAIRTVVTRALKRYIKASTDAHIRDLLDEIERTDTIAAAESEMEIEVEAYANREPLALEPVDESGLTEAEKAEILARESQEATPGF